MTIDASKFSMISRSAVASVPLDAVPEKSIRSMYFAKGEMKGKIWSQYVYAINVYAVTLNGRVCPGNIITCSPGDQIAVNIYWRVVKGEDAYEVGDRDSLISSSNSNSLPHGALTRFNLGPYGMDDKHLPFILGQGNEGIQPDGQEFYPCIDPRDLGDEMGHAVGQWDAKTKIYSREEGTAKFSNLARLSRFVFNISATAVSSTTKYQLKHKCISTSFGDLHQVKLKDATKMGWSDFTIEIVNPKAKL